MEQDNERPFRGNGMKTEIIVLSRTIVNVEDMYISLRKCRNVEYIQAGEDVTLVVLLPIGTISVMSFKKQHIPG